MADLKKIIELVKSENGKIFVSDENGEIQLVIMGIGEYEQLRSNNDYLGLSEKVERLAEQAEALNRKVTEAQMEELLEESETQSVHSSENRENLYIEPIEEE